MKNIPTIVVENGRVVQVRHLDIYDVIDLDDLKQGCCPDCGGPVEYASGEHICLSCGTNWDQWGAP